MRNTHDAKSIESKVPGQLIVKKHGMFWLFHRQLKFIWQRLTRGFSDEVLWNLDKEFAKWMSPRLKRYWELTENACWPGCVSNKTWNKIMWDMIEGLHLSATEFEWDGDETIDAKERTRRYQQMDKAMRLFGKYGRALWW